MDIQWIYIDHPKYSPLAAPNYELHLQVTAPLVDSNADDIVTELSTLSAKST